MGEDAGQHLLPAWKNLDTFRNRVEPPRRPTAKAARAAPIVSTVAGSDQ